MKAFGSIPLSHAYIISGISEESRYAFARYAAKVLVCSSGEQTACGVCSNCVKAENNVHPDIITVEREQDKREIHVNQMRSIRADAAVLPNEAARKVYIIKNADSMNIQSQNAMLKTFEEPPSFASFLLLSENPGALIPTVRSRCIELYAHDAAAEEQEVPGSDALEFLKIMAHGDRASLMRRLFSLDRMDKNTLSVFIPELRRAAVCGLRGDQRIPKIPPDRLIRLVHVLDKAESYAGFNVGTGHIAGLLMSELI